MSSASKCDRCGSLFEPEFGCVSLDVHVTTKESPDTQQNWSDVDFCPKCSKEILDLIGPAINDVVRP